MVINIGFIGSVICFLPDGFKTQDLWKVFGFFANFFKCVFLVADVVFGCWKKKQDFVQLINFVLVIQVLL